MYQTLVPLRENPPVPPKSRVASANRQPEAPIVGLGSVGRLKLRSGSLIWIAKGKYDSGKCRVAREMVAVAGIEKGTIVFRDG